MSEPFSKSENEEVIGTLNRILELEEYARAQISAEEEHLAGIRKMMRKPGSIK